MGLAGNPTSSDTTTYYYSHRMGGVRAIHDITEGETRNNRFPRLWWGLGWYSYNHTPAILIHLIHMAILIVLVLMRPIMYMLGSTVILTVYQGAA